MMRAIFRGRRDLALGHDGAAVWLGLSDQQQPHEGMRVPLDDPDLIVDPTDEDLELEAFERGEINAFEYPDGHTYPRNREIQRLTLTTGRRVH